MPFPVLGSNSAVAGYEIDNSLRFNDGDSAYLSKSLGASAGGSNTNATFSFWIKRGVLEGQQILFNSYVNASNYFRINLRADDAGTAPSGIEILDIASGSDNGSRISNQVFRDVSAWYHIFLTTDSDNGTNEDRVKVYINNERITSWASSVSWGSTFKHFADNATLYIGTREGAAQYYDGYFAEFHAVDGQELAPTDFGETNDNGVWIPKAYEGTYGTNGFKLEFKNSGSLGTDTSGNGNNFTATNLTATDQTTDTPTNNFCTLNSLVNFGGATLSEGNTKNVTPSPAGNGLVPATMGVKSGKWYWEINVSTTNFVACGIIADDRIHGQVTGLTKADSLTRVVKGDDGTKFSSNTSGGSYMAAYEGSILQVALNLDDGEITFGAGGSWANGSGLTNQTFATSTPAYTDLNSSSDFTNKFILPAIADENQGTSDTMEVNFGNPSFSISSGNSDANGYGNFEYAVPSGYYALCTKNLAEYG